MQRTRIHETNDVMADLTVGAKDKDAAENDGGGAFLLKKLLSSRTVLISGGIDSPSAQRVVNQLLLLEADDPAAPITVIINSPGGSVSDGLAIYDMIRFVTPRVRIVCAGLVASIAVIILAAADKADRVTLPNTRFMIHQPLIPMSVYGPASDLEITAREILKTCERLNRVLADATGKSLETVDRDTQRDHWLDANEALDYGLVDRIVATRAELA